MDGKEVKSLLKQARDAIKDKDYKNALKHCKAVLKIDKNNYNAWVFVGAAAQEMDQLDQAEGAFKRAIEISPDQLLAWQGICNFYEKHKKEEYIPELLVAYKKLLDLLESDSAKKLEIYDKLIDCVRTLHDHEKVIKVLKSKLDLIKGDSAKELAVYNEIYEEIKGRTSLSSYEKEVLSEALQAISSQESFTENRCSQIFSACIDALYKVEENQNFAISLALPIYQKYPDYRSCLEFFCRSAMNSYLESKHLDENLHELAEKMKVKDQSGLSSIFLGFVNFTSKKYLEAVHLCQEGLQTLEFCYQGWYFLSYSQLKLHRFKDSIISCKRGIDVCSKLKVLDNILGQFYLLLGQGLCGCQNFNIAVNAIEKSIEILGMNRDTLLVFCTILLKIGLLEKAEKMFEEFRSKMVDADSETLQLEGYLLLLKKDFTNALTVLRKSVALKECPYTLHLIALVLWESDQREKAFKVFIKAVELDPFFAQNFLYLGHYYQFVLHDQSKAAIFYQKAFDLDSFDLEIGMSLSKILTELKREDDNIKVLKIITEQSSFERCKWAWIQLGLSQLQQNLFSDAISSLQSAVRGDPTSSHAWECLADAYLKRGSFESALKAFEKASEINPKAMYPLYQMATIQKMRGFYYEAIDQYKNLLNIVSTYIPALIGMAETLILLSKKCFSECLFGLSRDYCQETLYTLARVSSSNSTLSCLWKLAGDACTLPFQYDEAWFPITVPPELHQEPGVENLVCSKPEILAYGAQFFAKAISLKKNVSTLWHDLGINFYYQAKISTSVSDSLDLSKRSFVCLQKAVSLSPNYEHHWTTLGVISLEGLKDYAFGQHALIKSLEVNTNNAETWSNLGSLYLLQNNLKLANAVFKKAQAVEPTYPISWIGQSIIADIVHHEETIDLYRHATTLGSHPEALLGYSRVVCDTILNAPNKNSRSFIFNIETMDAVVTAADCSVKFTSNQNKSPEAFNMLGMLLERQGIYNAAMNSFKRALELLTNSDKVDFVERVRMNYARILCSTGLVDESVSEFLLLKTIDASVLCSFSVAFYKKKNFEQALKLLQQAFNLSKEPGEKSHIKVAMAIVAKNVVDGPNPLSLLYESSQLKPASVPGLLALCACGILKENQDLTVAAQKELRPYQFSKEYASSIAFLSAALVYVQKGATAASRQYSKSVHCKPNNGAMWLQMAKCLLQWDRQFASNAALCTKVGTYHGGHLEEASQIYALCQISMGYRKGALSAAQKAVHMNPGNLPNWISLAAACHVAEKDRSHTGWIFSFVKKLAKDQGGIKPHLLGSLIILEAFHYIETQKFSEADNLISKALSIPSFSQETQSTLQILDATVKVLVGKGNLEPLVVAIKSNPKLFLGWHILSQLLLSSDKILEAEKTLSQFAVTAEKIFPKWMSFPLLQLSVLAYKAMHATEDRQRWRDVGEQMSGKAVHQSPDCQAARFMQGLFALQSGNTNLARRSFEKVLSSSTVEENKWMVEITHRIMEVKNLKRKNKDGSS